MKTRGEIGLNGQNQEVDIFIPGSYAQAHEQVKNLLNVPLMVLVKDSDQSSDFWLQLGSENCSAWLTAEFTTGTTKDGVKGYAFKIIYDGGILIYNVEGGPSISTT